MLEREMYLGDAVYASFDGYNIWLRTGDGNNQRIALEPAVLDAFDSYRKQLNQYNKEYLDRAEKLKNPTDTIVSDT